MSTYSLFVLLLFSGQLMFAQAQTYVTANGKTEFFSETPVENIHAVNKTSLVALNTATGDIAARIKIRDFVFPNKLMQEHFNENYMESERLPLATFSGKITNPPDYTKNGTFPVTASGKITIHGVTKDRELKGKLTVQDGKISLQTEFDVALSDHNIEVPTLVFVKIAQVIRVKADYMLLPKN